MVAEMDRRVGNLMKLSLSHFWLRRSGEEPKEEKKPKQLFARNGSLRGYQPRLK